MKIFTDECVYLHAEYFVFPKQCFPHAHNQTAALLSPSTSPGENVGLNFRTSGRPYPRLLGS